MSLPIIPIQTMPNKGAAIASDLDMSEARVEAVHQLREKFLGLADPETGFPTKKPRR
jgi:hypothetical protein